LGSLALTLAERPDGETAELASGLFEIALADEPSDARTRAAFGHARSLAGDAPGADAALAVALRDAPRDALVQRDAGYAALAEHAPAEAEARFRRAIALDDRSASAWFGLGRALARAEQTEAAFDALTRARTLGWSAELDLELGRLDVAAHRAADARAR